MLMQSLPRTIRRPAIIFIRARVHAQPPLRLSVIVSDAVSNLRSSLELLAWQLVLVNGKKPKGIFFPINDDRQEFETKALRKVKAMRTKAIAIIKTLKPYKGGNDGLWRLHELSNITKHRYLVTVGAAFPHATFDMIPPEWDVPPDVRKAMRIGIRPADWGFPLIDGTALYHVKAADRRKVDLNPQFSFDIALGESGVIESEAVLPAFHQMTGLVKQVVELFVPLFP